MSVGVPRALVEQAFRISIPSRHRSFTTVTAAPGKMQPGGLYVALPREPDWTWPHRDEPHDIVRAIAGGATAVVAQRDDIEVPAGVTRLVARDTFHGLWNLAVRWRARHRTPVVAVAGSVGKTTTAHLLTTLLEASGLRVHRTRDNQNGWIGLPMTVLGVRAEHDVSVIEVGINAPGQMRQLIELVRPTHAIVTAIGEEHLDELRDLDTVAEEECVILDDVIRRKGVAFIDGGDAYLRRWYGARKRTRCVRHAIGGAPAELSGVVARRGRTMVVHGCGLSQLAVPLRLQGAHNATNLLGAIAVARALGVSGEALVRGARKATPVDGRSQVRTLPPGVTVISDYFNANPSSMTAGLQLLATQPGRRWACLGDMTGLGNREEHYHRRLADVLAAAEFARVELVGDRMAWLADELAAQRFAGKVRRHRDAAGIARTLARELRAGDAVLLKASPQLQFGQIWTYLAGSAAER